MNALTKNITTALYFMLLFFTPVINTAYTNEQYEFPKMFFVYFIGVTVLFLYLLRVILGYEKLRPIELSIVLYSISAFLSAIFSSHIYTSFWGYYSRFNDGFVSIIVFVALYVVARSIFSTLEKTLLTDIACLTVFPLGIYALLQAATGMGRVYSTIGQPNWLAAYCVMLFPLILNNIVVRKNLAARVFWLLAICLAVLTIFLTLSISGFIGLIIMCLYIFIVHLKSLGNTSRLKQFVAFVLLCAILLPAFSQSMRQRFYDAVNLSGNAETYRLSDTGFIRLTLWGDSTKIPFSNLKNFIIGTGLETFPYIYPFYRSSKINFSSEWEFIINKPHNYYIETFVESGLFGVASYIFLIISSSQRKKKPRGFFIKASLIGFYITNLFGFPVVSTNLLFWILLSL